MESERRFIRKPVSVDQLLPVWSIANVHINEYLSPSDATGYILNAVGDYFVVNDCKNTSLESLHLLRNISGLSSDSIEKRVEAFNQLSSEILQRAQPARETTPSVIDGLLLAAAAFLVGRGTSHVFLLQRMQRFAPTAAAWFGVMAALTGPRAWDKAWLKATKGAERLLRPEFNRLEASSADICWSEFSWLARTFTGIEIFLDLPRMHPRALSIEIVPAATCQFRLTSESVESEAKKTPDPSPRENMLSSNLPCLHTARKNFSNRHHLFRVSLYSSL